MSQYFQRPILHGRDHLTRGPDPIPGLPDPGGQGIIDIIMGKNPVGLWKLDELSGTTAADSSGAGNDMTVPGGFSYAAPTWGEAAGPPGTTTALFARGAGVTAGTRLNVTMPSGMTGDFSAGLWVYVNVTSLLSELLGQGRAIHASGVGWTLFYDGTDKFSVRIRNGSGFLISCDNTSAAGAWYLFGVSVVAGTWTMYLDGEAQTATGSGTPTGDTDTWLGDCGTSSANHGCDQTLSWAFIVDDPLTAEDWLELYEAGVLPGVASGKVWTADGTGGASWEYPTIEMEY